MKFHPIQVGNKESGRLRTEITLRAYEVYKKVYGEQKALIEGWCRGGFGLEEIIAFLYARSFPENEWSNRVNEAFEGIKLKERR